MKKISLLLLGAVMTLSAGTAPQGFEIWQGSQLKELGKQLAPKVDAQHVALQQLAKYDNHGVLLIHREGSGEAELHETQVDLFFVQSGQATLVIGGAMVDGRTTAPHEIRGPSINGGDTRKLGAGDVVHIPAGVPHQVMVESGKQFDYVVIKVDAK
jgi:mannose-6-phosphate isomerase-like protein (cupin superfamily)